MPNAELLPPEEHAAEPWHWLLEPETLAAFFASSPTRFPARWKGDQGTWVFPSGISYSAREVADHGYTYVAPARCP